MYSPRKLLIGFALASVLVGGLFVATVSADDPPTPTPNNSTGKVTIVDQFISRLAQNLGISRETLTGAMKQTRDGMVDEAVQQGKLTEEQGDKLKSNGTLGWLGRALGRHGRAELTAKLKSAGHDYVLQALANLLNTTPEDVISQVRSGKTVDQILADNGKTREDLRAAVVASAEDDLNQAVANGKLTQEQADKILEHIKSAPLQDNGLHRGWSKGGRSHPLGGDD